MGFNNFGRGPVLPCGIMDGVLRTKLLNGEEKSWTLDMFPKIDFRYQITQYRTKTVLFYLEQGPHVIAGRTDGYFTQYYDGYIIRTQPWSIGKASVEWHVGYCLTLTGIEEVYVSEDQPDMAYSKQSTFACVLDRPFEFNDECEPSTDMALACISQRTMLGVRDTGALYSGVYINDWKGENYRAIKSHIPYSSGNKDFKDFL